MTIYLEKFDINLNKMRYENDDDNHILQLNYAYLISCMETYLSHAMWGMLDEHPENYNNLGKGINNSAKLSTIFGLGLPSFIKQELNGLQYHNLAQVKMYYKHAFEVNFPPNLTNLFKAVNIRHNIVHRCGVSKKGIDVDINFERVEKLKIEIQNFLIDIDTQLEERFQL